MSPKKTLISVVTPCFNEHDNVNECYEAVKRTFERDLPGYDFEHIFCDNDSKDETVDILRGIAGRDRRVKVVVNSRNFGLFCSMFNGLMHTRGDAVVVLFPADLQDPPELIPEFVAKWREGYEVVYGIKKKREENVFLRSARRIYYRLVSRFANIDIPVDVSEFQLVDRVVVDALRRFDDYYPYLRGMIANCGFRATGIEYTWKARKRGLTKHNMYHLVDQGLNGLISFTKLPMRLCMFFGFALSRAEHHVGVREPGPELRLLPQVLSRRHPDLDRGRLLLRRPPAVLLRDPGGVHRGHPFPGPETAAGRRERELINFDPHEHPADG